VGAGAVAVVALTLLPALVLASTLEVDENELLLLRAAPDHTSDNDGGGDVSDQDEEEDDEHDGPGADVPPLVPVSLPDGVVPTLARAAGLLLLLTATHHPTETARRLWLGLLAGESGPALMRSDLSVLLASVLVAAAPPASAALVASSVLPPALGAHGPAGLRDVLPQAWHALAAAAARPAAQSGREGRRLGILGAVVRASLERGAEEEVVLLSSRSSHASSLLPPDDTRTKSFPLPSSILRSLLANEASDVLAASALASLPPTPVAAPLSALGLALLADRICRDPYATVSPALTAARPLVEAGLVRAAMAASAAGGPATGRDFLPTLVSSNAAAAVAAAASSADHTSGHGAAPAWYLHAVLAAAASSPSPQRLYLLRTARTLAEAGKFPRVDHVDDDGEEESSAAWTLQRLHPWLLSATARTPGLNHALLYGSPSPPSVPPETAHLVALVAAACERIPTGARILARPTLEAALCVGVSDVAASFAGAALRGFHACGGGVAAEPATAVIAAADERVEEAYGPRAPKSPVTPRVSAQPLQASERSGPASLHAAAEALRLAAAGVAGMAARTFRPPPRAPEPVPTGVAAEAAAEMSELGADDADADADVEEDESSAPPLLLIDDDLGPSLGTGLNVRLDDDVAGTPSDASLDLRVDAGGVRTRLSAKRELVRRFAAPLLAQGGAVLTCASRAEVGVELPAFVDGSGADAGAPFRVTAPSLADLLLLYARIGGDDGGSAGPLAPSPTQAASTRALRSVLERTCGERGDALALARAWLLSALHAAVASPALPKDVKIAACREFARWFARDAAAARVRGQARGLGRPTPLWGAGTASVAADTKGLVAPSYVRDLARQRAEQLALTGTLPPLCSPLYAPPPASLSAPSGAFAASSGTVGASPALEIHALKALAYLVSGSAPGDCGRPGGEHPSARAVAAVLAAHDLASPLAVLLALSAAGMRARAEAMAAPSPSSPLPLSVEVDRAYRDFVAVGRQAVRVIANTALHAPPYSRGSLVRALHLHPEASKAFAEIVNGTDLKARGHAWRCVANLGLPPMATQTSADVGGGGLTSWGDLLYPLHRTQPTASRDAGLTGDGVDIVLVHGLQGVALKTWRSAVREDGSPLTASGPDALPPSVPHVLRAGLRLPLWPIAWLADDIERDARALGGAASDVRVLAVAYDADMLAASSLRPHVPIGDTAAEVARQLAGAGVGGERRKVVFVAHSMGGLLVKRVLLHSAAEAEAQTGGAAASPPQPPPPRSIADATTAIVFLGVPHLGAPIATWAVQRLSHVQRWLPSSVHPSPHVTDLASAEGIAALNESFVAWVRGREAGAPLTVLSLAEGKPTSVPSVRPGATGVPPPPPPPPPPTAAGVGAPSSPSSSSSPLDIFIVPRDVADPGVGTARVIEGSDHVSICKPPGKSSELYAAVRGAVEDGVGEGRTTTS
jgi:hypothetical protein